MNIDTNINSRIITVYDILLREKRVKNKSEFCKAIDYSNVSWAKVEINARKFPKAKLKQVSQVFGVSSLFLTEGKAPIFDHAKPKVLAVKTNDLRIDKIDHKTIVKFTDEEGIPNVIEFIYS